MNKNSAFDSWKLQDKYDIIKQIGAGSYGSVVKAKCVKTGKDVAIKRINQIFDDLIDGKRILREIALLRRLNHQNIINIIEILKPENMNKFNEIYVVLEYLPSDLKKMFKSNMFLQPKHIIKITYHMLLALKYLHSNGVLHRDLKPANVLINNDCFTKLCDFGLARSIEEKTPNDFKPEAMETNEKVEEKPVPGKKKNLKDMKKNKVTSKLTNHVVTRWYRAPELILIEKNYDSKIDVWSIGCIFAELLGMMKEHCQTFLDRQPLFPGQSCFPLSPDSNARIKKCGFPVSQMDQLIVILKILGTPDENDIKFITDEKAIEYLRSFPKSKKNDFSEMFPNATNEMISFLESTLKFNPNKRISVDESLNHPLFKEIRNEKLEIQKKEKIYFEFESIEINKEDDLRKLFIEEINYYN